MEIIIKYSFNLLHLQHLDEFLNRNGRNIHSILCDGNCLFRALSHQLYGTDEHHLFLWTTLVRYENLNCSTFETYLIPSMNEYSIPSHCNKLASPGVWGTQVELVATATLTGKPVYLLINSSQRIHAVGSILASYKNRKSEDSIYYWGWQCSCLPCSTSFGVTLQ